jgi:fatty acid desaturase
VASQTMAANEQALAWSMVEDTSPHQLSEPTRATAARGRPPSDLLTWALVIWLVVVIAFVAAVGVGVVMMWGVFPHAL